MGEGCRGTTRLDTKDKLNRRNSKEAMAILENNVASRAMMKCRVVPTGIRCEDKGNGEGKILKLCLSH